MMVLFLVVEQVYLLTVWYGHQSKCETWYLCEVNDFYFCLSCLCLLYVFIHLPVILPCNCM